MVKALKRLLVGSLLITAAWADEPILRVIDLKTPTGAIGQIQHRRATDKQWYQAYVGSTGILRDRFKTSPETVAALEFFIGGRVGVNRDTEIEVVTERSVAGVGDSPQKIILVNGALWLKASPLKKPLEIQTNGGTMAIRGTEFTVESKPDNTTLSVLDGSVEVRDAQQKLLGLARPGEVYSLSKDREPTVQQFDPSELRRQLEGSPLGLDMALVKAELQGVVAKKSGLDALSRKLDEMLEKLIHLAPPYQQAILQEPVEAVGGVQAGGQGGQPGLPPVVQGMEPSQAVKSVSLFRWLPHPQADGYVIFVSADSYFANEILFSARTRDSVALYPSQARPLEPGLYYWRVIPVDARDEPLPGAATQATFRVSPTG
jgi:hypothetical protein